MEEILNRDVCSSCISEEFLMNQIEKEGIDVDCYYCKQNGKCISLQEFADHVEFMFAQHYQRTSSVPTAFEEAMQNDRENPKEWYREGDLFVDILPDVAEISVDITEDVRTILENRHRNDDVSVDGEECEFDPEARYAARDQTDEHLFAVWKDFEAKLKSESRFFNIEARDFLDKIFANLISIKTKAGSVLMTGGPDSKISS